MLLLLNKYRIENLENLNKVIKKGNMVTVCGKVENNTNNKPIAINLYNKTGKPTGINILDERTYEVDDYPNLSNLYAFYNQLIPYEGGQYRLKIHPERQANDYIYMSFYDVNKKLIKTDTDYIYYSIPEQRVPAGTRYFSVVLRAYHQVEDVHYWEQFTVQVEKGTVYSDYEPFRDYVNDEPMIVQPDEDGKFAITIKADRDYAEQIAIHILDEEGCVTGEVISVTDLVVLEGDYSDCHPTDYMDPSETRYLAEYRTTNDPYGFGKHRLI